MHVNDADNGKLISFSPQRVESLRGHFVKVTFQPELKSSPVTGRLYNVDPHTGTVFLFDFLGGGDPKDDAMPFRIIMRHSIESFEGKHLSACGDG